MTQPSILIATEPATDLMIVEAMAVALENYIVGDDLYHTITVRTDAGEETLQMTGADLLTRLYRLQGESAMLSGEEQARFTTAKLRVEQTIATLRTRFYARLQREIKTRLASLKWFLDDYAADPQRCRIEFPFEMRNRQQIEEALKLLEYQLPASLQHTLQVIDERLRQVAMPAEFIWDSRWKPIFPPQPYWYLYRRP